VFKTGKEQSLAKHTGWYPLKFDLFCMEIVHSFSFQKMLITKSDVRKKQWSYCGHFSPCTFSLRQPSNLGFDIIFETTIMKVLHQ